MHAGLYHYAQEAEFGAAQGRQGAPDQRVRGHRLHSGGRPQPSGALGGYDTRRPRQGPAGGALPHPARRPRYAGRQEPQAAPLEIRRQAAEVNSLPGGEARPGERDQQDKTWTAGTSPATTKERNKCPAVTVPRDARFFPIRNSGTWSYRSS